MDQKPVTNAWIDWFHIFIILVNTNNIVMWVILLNNADWDCFKIQTLQEILRIQNQHQVEQCAFLEVIRSFRSVGMCKKQISVSHSSTEPEIISLDARLTLDGIPALKLWDLIVAVLHGNRYQINEERRDPHKSPTRNKIHGKIDPDNVGFVSSNVHFSRKEVLLYISEDNKAVIKMIINWRSLTTRHVSKTHRVALDWLFDRINLDHQNQNQIHWHQEPFRRHTDKGKFDTWRMDHLFVFVQHQPFQLHQ